MNIFKYIKNNWFETLEEFENRQVEPANGSDLLPNINERRKRMGLEPLTLEQLRGEMDWARRQANDKT